VLVAELREDIRTTIPAIAEHLMDSDWDVCMATVGILSGLAAQGMCQDQFLFGVLKHVCSSIPGGYSDHHPCHCGRSEGFSF